MQKKLSTAGTAAVAGDGLTDARARGTLHLLCGPPGPHAPVGGAFGRDLVAIGRSRRDMVPAQARVRALARISSHATFHAEAARGQWQG